MKLLYWKLIMIENISLVLSGSSTINEQNKA